MAVVFGKWSSSVLIEAHMGGPCTQHRHIGEGHRKQPTISDGLECGLKEGHSSTVRIKVDHIEEALLLAHAVHQVYGVCSVDLVRATLRGDLVIVEVHLHEGCSSGVDIIGDQGPDILDFLQVSDASKPSGCKCLEDGYALELVLTLGCDFLLPYLGEFTNRHDRYVPVEFLHGIVEDSAPSLVLVICYPLALGCPDHLVLIYCELLLLVENLSKPLVEYAVPRGCLGA